MKANNSELKIHKHLLLEPNTHRKTNKNHKKKTTWKNNDDNDGINNHHWFNRNNNDNNTATDVNRRDSHWNDWRKVTFFQISLFVLLLFLLFLSVAFLCTLFPRVCFVLLRKLFILFSCIVYGDTKRFSTRGLT